MHKQFAREFEMYLFNDRSCTLNKINRDLQIRRRNRRLIILVKSFSISMEKKTFLFENKI